MYSALLHTSVQIVHCTIPGNTIHITVYGMSYTMYATCGSYDHILFCYYFLIEVELIHNVMLVSGIQQSDLMIYHVCVSLYTYIYTQTHTYTRFLFSL